MNRPSFPALVQMFNDGKLGELLLKHFGGEIGHLDANKDSQFIIEFPDPTSVPSAESIRQVVQEHYTSLGYEVKKGSGDSVHGPGLLMGHQKTMPEGIVSIIMTIPYPNNGHNNNLAVTCEVHC